MDVDSKYPALSALAQTEGHSLCALGASAASEGKYFRLSGCCHWVLNELPHVNAPDPYSYLATIDALLRRIPNESLMCRKVWKKLVGGVPSAVLDMVVEASWILHFWDSGHQATIEEPFDPADPNSKDADIVVMLDSSKHWLDVLNISLAGPNESIISNEKTDLVSVFANRAKRKYKDKFRAAVISGIINHASVGILLCILKSEEAMVPFLTSTPTPPSKLFGPSSPGLNIVWTHTLRTDQNSDVLRPFPIIKWSRA